MEALELCENSLLAYATAEGFVPPPMDPLPAAAKGAEAKRRGAAAVPAHEVERAVALLRRVMGPHVTQPAQLLPHLRRHALLRGQMLWRRGEDAAAFFIVGESGGPSTTGIARGAAARAVCRCRACPLPGRTAARRLFSSLQVQASCMRWRQARCLQRAWSPGTWCWRC